MVMSQRKNRTPKSKLIMRRGRSRRRRGVQLFAPEIPFDLVIEIMARLPGKSLMRFKCVSNLWYSLIRSRYFSNLYYTLASPRRPPPRLYITVVDRLKCDSLGFCNKPHESVMLSLKPSANNKSFDLDLTMPGMGGRGRNLATLRGLIIYNVCSKGCIYNPTTRQTLKLPAVKSTMYSQQQRIDSVNRVVYSLGHDPVLDQYKVFCTVVTAAKIFKRITSEHWVLVLEAGGGSWTRVQFDLPHFPNGLGVCIDGVIYYLAFISRSREILLSFDVRCEKLNMIQVPHVLTKYGEFAGLIQYGRKPAIFNVTNLARKGYADLWLLEDAGNWSTKSLVLPPCQTHLVDNDIPLTVRGTTQNGEVILVPNGLDSLSYILFYDLQKNDLRKIKLKGIPKEFINSYVYMNLMDEGENIMHLEI
ncbi:PREDICTED: putative F-box protein At5g62660 [Camelina sativa]|uniref:F-box protein At5g62660 n=1 Tax=Camelina sativa TaxID=90675 RepID=A0ABM0VPA9_CAMSA|nr:PREDICTED: putative F-box protein At5g62660 [Camelina sativa]